VKTGIQQDWADCSVQLLGWFQPGHPVKAELTGVAIDLRNWAEVELILIRPRSHIRLSYRCHTM
jgi:hypothetical protein